MFNRRFLIALGMVSLAQAACLNTDEAQQVAIPRTAVPVKAVPVKAVPVAAAPAIAKPQVAKPPEEDAEPDQVVAQCQFVEIRGNLKKALTEAGFRELTSGTRFVFPSHAQSSDESEAYTTMWKAISVNAEIEVLSRPQIRALIGYESQVSFGASKSIPYLVKMGENSFEARESTDAQLGVHALFHFHPGHDPDQVLISPLKISTTTLDGREPIPGLDLDVGKPIISTRTLETSITLNEGSHLNAIALPGPPGRQLVLFLSVRQIRSHKDETLPNPPIEVPGAVRIKISPQGQPTPGAYQSTPNP